MTMTADNGGGSELVETSEPEGRASRQGACIIVAGMHRSGTSALTRVLNLMGAALPKNVLGADMHNPTGHWEPTELLELHKRFLDETGSGWDDWRPLDPALLNPAKLQRYRAEITQIIQSEYDTTSLFVIKEPRISRFIWLYKDVLASMNVDICYVIMQRNPLAVMASLADRDGFTRKFSGLVWLRHQLEAEKATRGARRAIVSYENLVTDWQAETKKIAGALDLTLQAEGNEEIGGYVSGAHQHHRATQEMLNNDPEANSWLKRAYEAFQVLASKDGDAEAFAVLDRISAEMSAHSAETEQIVFDELRARQKLVEKLSAETAGGESGSESALNALSERIAEVDERISKLLESNEQMRRQFDEIKSMPESRLWRIARRVGSVFG